MAAPLQPDSCWLHGHELRFLSVGEGPPVVLVHGLLQSHRTWLPLAGDLGRDHRVIAPDLFGHGGSDKHAGDYSLGSHAATIRDLLDRLELPAVSLVGHSLGGGVALQFTYLFPDRVSRLALVSSGGLGRELSVVLRAPTLPGAEWVLPLLASRYVLATGDRVGRLLSGLGLRGGADVSQTWDGFLSLASADSRRAFLATARAVVGPEGQRVSANDRLPLLARFPTLLVWGGRDPLIPVQHARAAHRRIPGSRLEIFPGAGHFPHLDEPERFAELLRKFVNGPIPDHEGPDGSGGSDGSGWSG